MSWSSKRVAAREGVLVREVQGEAVLLNLDRECYFGLDPVGTRMWGVLTQAGNVQLAIDQLGAEYEVDPAELGADVGRFLGELEDAGLVDIQDA